MSQSVTTKTEQGLYVHPEALTAHLPALDYRDGALYMEQVSIDEGPSTMVRRVMSIQNKRF